MKKRKLLCLVLIAGCLAVFFGYRLVDRLGTDTKAPEITISPETPQVSVRDSRELLLQGVTAEDRTDGDVTASLVVESVKLTDSDGTVNVTYAAFDAAGNVAKAERQARYTDYESPKFSLSEPLTFAQNSGFNVFDIVTAEDMLDGDITHRIRVTSLDESSITALGTHQIEFRVSNSMGETVKLVLPLEVYLAGSYQATVELTDYLVYLPVGSAFNASSYLESYTRAGDVVSLSAGMPSGYTLRTDGTVDTGTPGVYSVDYRVTYTKEYAADPSLNQSYTGYTRLIVVVEG
ncbi:MAG: hypothetical protein IJ375_05345 [Oscillospiraceae bacterium]|nr:hypothetical protein [Oscillospiraceae bacterium]